MTHKELAQSFVDQAKAQGFDNKQSVEVAAFAVDKIINYTEWTADEYLKWITVMDELESMM
jgi:hypothetical protein